MRKFLWSSGLIAAGVSVVLVFSGCTNSTDSLTSPTPSMTASGFDATTTSRLQEVLDAARTADGFPGVIATVISPQGVWRGASGTARKGENIPLIPTDKTRIGSLTKTMTATVLLQLFEENRLSLDDLIEKYVPGMPNGQSATLRQLANMTSGIPSYTAVESVQNEFFAHPENAWAAQQLVDSVKGSPAQFPSGKGWEYSNTNYVLLGMVCEKILEKPLREIFEERIFAPLGMSETLYPGESTVIADPHLFGETTQGQSQGQPVDSTNWNPSFASTAGAVISTLDDLQKWGDALFTGVGILSEATQTLRHDSIIYNIPPNTATSGYGIGIGNRNGWWGHDGDIPGYTSVLLHSYDQNTTIIVLVNSDTSVSSNGSSQSPAIAIFSELQKVLFPG